MSAQFICEFLTHYYVRRILIKFFNIHVCNYTWPTRTSFGEILRILRLPEAETQPERASFSRIWSLWEDEQLKEGRSFFRAEGFLNGDICIYIPAYVLHIWTYIYSMNSGTKSVFMNLTVKFYYVLWSERLLLKCIMTWNCD